MAATCVPATPGTERAGNQILPHTHTLTTLLDLLEQTASTQKAQLTVTLLFLRAGGRKEEDDGGEATTVEGLTRERLKRTRGWLLVVWLQGIGWGWFDGDEFQQQRELSKKRDELAGG